MSEPSTTPTFAGGAGTPATSSAMPPASPPPTAPVATAPVAAAAVPEGIDVNALLAQVNALQAQLQSLGATGVPAPEPRFKTIGSLFRELARNSLTGDVLHEFLTIVDRIDDEVPAAPDPASAPADG